MRSGRLQAPVCLDRRPLLHRTIIERGVHRHSGSDRLQVGHDRLVARVDVVGSELCAAGELLERGAQPHSVICEAERANAGKAGE